MNASSYNRPAVPTTAGEMFKARCEARAHLYGIGEFDLHDG